MDASPAPAHPRPDMRNPLICLALLSALPALAAEPRVVPTFESLGIYWTPPANPGAGGCPLRFRKSGESAWREALPLWFDARNGECRGSIVQLEPGSAYDISVGGRQVSARTWSERFPVAKIITIANQATVAITEGGSANGYVLYQGAPGAVIDAADKQPVGISIAASYVIVRGFTVRGAQRHGILIEPGNHDVVIERNDVSGWGRYNYTNSAGWKVGVDEDSGISARCYNNAPEVYRIVIQRNKVHDPRYGANSWDWGHPAGPNAISAYECGGNNVIRYNEVWSSDPQHYFMDAIGGGNNDSNKGWPGADSDVYGNLVQNAWDDGIEAEGGGQNVRVWGNYIDNTATGVATTPVAIGPIYVFRNVYNRSRQRALRALDEDDRNRFAKSGSWAKYGNGRRYVFHNTVLQPRVAAARFPLGAGQGVGGAGRDEPLTNTVSRNNILQVWKPSWTSVDEAGGAGNDFDYDLYNGQIAAYRGAEKHGIAGVPSYERDFVLARRSAGIDAGVRIPNFNDNYVGAAPDIGAQETGAATLRFGVDADESRVRATLRTASKQ
jgi:hypothetical protein